MRTTIQYPTWRSEAAMSHLWLRLALFVPLGFAVSRTAGPDAAAPTLLVLAASAACLHKLMPWLVEVVAGVVALIVTVSTAAEAVSSGSGPDFTHLTQAGNVVLVFGGLVSASAFVRLLGSGNGREMARHLLAGAAALQIGLVLVGVPGRSILHVEGESTRAVMLAVILLAGTVVGVRSRMGFPLLGAGLLAAPGILALTGAPGVVGSGRLLLGTVTFALVAVWLHDADRSGVVSAWPQDDLAQAA